MSQDPAARQVTAAPTGDGPHVSRWVMRTALTGNVVLAGLGFWMSFQALSDLAARAGVAAQPFVWPLIVDGLIVVSTLSVLALSPFGRRATWFAWLLLAGGAAVSVLGNAEHALWYGDGRVPEPMRVTIAAVPPLVLLAATHLTVELGRRVRPRAPGDPGDSGDEAGDGPAVMPLVSVEQPASSPDRIEAGRLRALGWTNRRIARALGVHPSTVSRWLTPRDEPDEATAPGHEPGSGASSTS